MVLNISLVTKKVKLLNRYVYYPQMSGYIEYFENSEKNMFFVIKDDER